MSTEIINGKAVIHGIKNNGSAITMSFYVSFILDKVDAKHMFGANTVIDEGGNDAALIAFNEHAELTIDMTPTSTTRALVLQNGPLFMTPLATVTITNAGATGTFLSQANPPGTTASQIFNGLYTYVGDTSISFTAGQTGKITGIRIRKYADSTQNSSLTTQVVG